MASTRYYSMMNLSGQIALLADEEGRSVALPLTRLPDGMSVGSVLSVPLDNAGTPSWSAASIDRAEEDRRRDDEKRLEAGLQDQNQT